MPKFEDVSFQGKCDVCGQETEVVVAGSACGPASFSYCRRCLEGRLEPYPFMAACIAGAGHWPDDVNPVFRELVRRNLAFHGKTEDEFAADVERAIQAKTKIDMPPAHEGNP